MEICIEFNDGHVRKENRDYPCIEGNEVVTNNLDAHGLIHIYSWLVYTMKARSICMWRPNRTFEVQDSLVKGLVDGRKAQSVPSSSINFALYIYKAIKHPETRTPRKIKIFYLR